MVLDFQRIGGPARGVSPARAMRIMDELESGCCDSEEEDEANNTPQADSDDQPLHPNSNRSREEFMAMVAEQKARIKAMSPEERNCESSSN